MLNRQNWGCNPDRTSCQLKRSKHYALLVTGSLSLTFNTNDCWENGYWRLFQENTHRLAFKTEIILKCDKPDKRWLERISVTVLYFLCLTSILVLLVASSSGSPTTMCISSETKSTTELGFIVVCGDIPHVRVSMRWDTSLNCGHQQACCSSPGRHTSMESHGGMIETGRNRITQMTASWDTAPRSVAEVDLRFHHHDDYRGSIHLWNVGLLQWD
jgi:hypothetical protein